MTMPWRLASREQGFSQWFWPKGLLFSSLFVLAIPVAMWGAFWLRAPWNLLFVGAIVAALWFLPRGSGNSVLESDTRRELWMTALWAFMPLALMCVVSGIGGIGTQSEDWLKHNAVLADLVRSDWPVHYRYNSTPVHLTYYTAFYLPAAFMGKLGGWGVALAVHQLGSLIVLGLVAAWLSWIMGKRARWVGVLFAAFGGVDYFAAKIVALAHGQPFELAPFSLEWWEKPIPWWGYYSHVTELFWVPHAALAGWLGTVLLLRVVSPLTARSGGLDASWSDVSFDVVTCALLPLWNPWAWLGYLPLLGVRLVQQIRSRRRILIWPWVCLIGLWAMQFGYLMSRISLPAGISGGVGYHPTFTAFEFMRQYGSGVYIETWLGFTFVEFGFYALLCLLLWKTAKAPSPLRPFLVVSALALGLLPLFHYGLYNDLLRSAVAPLAVVCLSCATVLHMPRTRRTSPFKAVLALALCFGALHSAQYAINVMHDVKLSITSHSGLLHQPVLSKMPTVYALFAHDPHPQLITQYMGRDDSTWARWFLKR